MTIIQHFSGKKLSKQEEPLVPNEATENPKDVEEGRPVVVTMHAHVRRVSSMTTVCVFITSLLVLTTGVIGGVYLYKQFAHYKLRHFKGWCSIPYPEEADAQRHEALKGAFQQPTKETETKEKPKNTFFEEEFDIDIKTEQYERIGVPGFAHGRRAQFIHDFVVNKTGIVDFENRRCFLMVLNRNFVLPPRLLYEQVSKMRAGYYDIDIHVVRHTMQVIIPPVNDMKNVGFFIARDCSSFPIYMLERTTIPVHKRSIERTEATFVEFAGGDKINEIKIVNLDQAVPGEHS